MRRSIRGTGLLEERAKALLERFVTFRETMLDSLERFYPELAQDESMRRELRRSADTNMRTMLRILSGQLSESTPIPHDQLDLARSLSRRDIPLEIILESYRSAEETFRRVLLDELTSHTTDAAELASALRTASDQIAQYLGRSITAVIADYQAERERWVGQTIAARVDMARRLLRGDHVEIDRAERTLGYPLHLHHIGVVVWGETGTPETAIEPVARQLREAFGARGVLQIPIGPSSVWVWLALAGPIDTAGITKTTLDVLPAGVRGAVGRPEPGVPGFRQTHEQALRAERIAIQHWPAVAVTTYDQAEPLALISHDDTAAQAFVTRTLGALGAADSTTEELRDTLRVYLEEDGNARRAADRLHLHKNTVLYRIRRAEELIGHPIDGYRMVLSMALLAASRRPRDLI
jgi:DNA-binding PucR family transcriptional regulator